MKKRDMRKCLFVAYMAMTAGTDGTVIADSAGFVKIGNNVPPVATDVQVAGRTQVGGTLTGSYRYSDADTGNYLFFEVTPFALTGLTSGTASRSAPVYVLETAGFIQKLGSGNPQRIVFFGTSLTASGVWISQMQSAVDKAYPGLVTYINSGGSGKASDWGVTNLQTKVIALNPDVVFIEFSMNDAAVVLNISRAQALANLSSMVKGIRTARPNCEIILQLMNPVDRRDSDTYSPRPDLALYQQDYRDFAATHGLQCIDHIPAFQALLDEGSDAYRVFVPDGVHPNAEGFARYLTPVLLQALGLAPEISLEMDMVLDNSAPAPSLVLNGVWTSSTSTPGYLGTNYLHNGNTGQGSKSAVFTPNIPSAGVYPLFLHWTSDSNRATNAPVTVNYNGGSATMTVDQTRQGGTWFELGSYPFEAGTKGTVTIGTAGANGYVIVDGLGVGISQTSTVVRLRMDNGRAAEPSSPQAAARNSTLIVWRSGPSQDALAVQLNVVGGSAVDGSDYAALPASLVIPAGQSSAAVRLLPLYDLLTEGDETFNVSLVPAAGYSTDFPNKASIVIEDPVGSVNTPPVASSVAITGARVIGATLVGSYQYSDAENDVEGASLFEWLRSDNETLDAGDATIAGATNRSYTVQAGDSGKTLFFRVTPGAATESPVGSAAASGGVQIAAEPLNASITLIGENFGGTGAALNGKTADVFNPDLSAAGGSSAWVAAGNFLDNGAVVTDPAAGTSAYLNFGSFINNAKGTASGYFVLTLTISPIVGQWISLGFAAENTPSTSKNFTGTSGSPATTGLGTLLYRGTAATSPNNVGEFDMFGGNGNANGVDGPDGNTGVRTVSVTLDLTPLGGYNGTSNFGKVIWSDSVLGLLGSYTYTTAKSFGAVLISEAFGATGTIKDLSLTQQLPQPFRLAMILDEPNNYSFNWVSYAGRVYELVSSTNLAIPVGSWPAWDSRTNILSAGATTTLVNVPGGGPTRFFAVIERTKPLE